MSTPAEFARALIWLVIDFAIVYAAVTWLAAWLGEPNEAPREPDADERWEKSA